MTAKPLGYRIPTLATILGVSQVTIRRLIKSGDLQCIRLRGAIVVLQQDLDAYLSRQREQVATANSTCPDCALTRLLDNPATDEEIEKWLTPVLYQSAP